MKKAGALISVDEALRGRFKSIASAALAQVGTMAGSLFGSKKE